MKKAHRKILAELCEICNKIGGSLDGTATHVTKYIDRQEAHMKVYRVLYGLLVDSPENDQRELHLSRVKTALDELRAIADKKYPDRKGMHSFTQD